MSNGLLFVLCAFIWGTTWYAITFQHVGIAPIFSVGLRFLVAALLLGGWCFYKKLSLRFSWRIHFQIILAGVCLYTLDYTFLYLSQQYIVSGVLAVLSASVVYFTVLFRLILFKKPVRAEVLWGATISVVGLYLVFVPELQDISAAKQLELGLALATVSFCFAALGNVISEKVLEENTPVIQFNFLAMSYSLVFTFAYGLISGAAFVIPDSVGYWLSLLYLSLFGSVLAFGAYMKLLKNMGADKATNVVLVYPVVALVMSAAFEGYHLTLLGMVGIAAIMLGNAIAMDKLPRGARRVLRLASKRP